MKVNIVFLELFVLIFFHELPICLTIKARLLDSVTFLSGEIFPLVPPLDNYLIYCL